MEPTLAIGQRVLVNRIGMDFGEPHVGEIAVFHPPEGRRAGGVRAEAPCDQARRRSACSEPVPQQNASVNFIKRIVAGPGDEIYIKEGHVFRRAAGKSSFVREKDSYITRVRHEPGVQLPGPDQDSGRSLVHDGRQPWRIRRQQVLGASPHRMDHRRRHRHLLAPRPHRDPLAPPARTRAVSSAPPGPAQAPRLAPGAALAAQAAAGGCSPSTVASASASSRAPTRRDGAASPARWWRRACCSTTTRSPRASCARWAALNDSKQHSAEAREELYPLVHAQRREGRGGVAVRARDRRPRPAQDEPRRPARRHARGHRGGLRRGAVSRRRLLGGGVRAPPAGDRRRRRHQRGDRRGIDRRQGHP